LSAKESEQRLAAILDSITDGFFAVDRHLRFTHINDAALRHFGKRREDLLGRSLVEAFPLLENGGAQKAMLQAVATGVPVHFVGASVLTGQALETHVYPAAEGLTVLFRDVTESSRMTAALKEAHDRTAWLSRFPEENPHPVARVSAHGIVLYCNPAAGRAPGWQCELGKPIAAPIRPLVNRAINGTGHLEQDVELGNKVYVISVAPFAADAYVNVYGLDVTARRRAELALQQAHDELEARIRDRTAQLEAANCTLRLISQCNEALVRATDEPDLVRTVCRIIYTQGQYRMVWVGYAENDAARTVRPMAAFGFEEGYLEHAQITCADDEHGRGPTGTCIRTATPRVCHNFLTDPALAAWSARALERGYQSSLALPLRSGGRAFGALSIYSAVPDYFGAEQIALLTELADDMAFGIMALRAHAERDQARLTAESHAQQLRALAAALTMAEQRERQRLAQLLHDGLQQLLVAAKFRLGALERLPDQAVRDAAHEVGVLVSESIVSSRSLTYELSPPVLRQGGLVPALTWLVRWMEGTHGLEVRLKTVPDIPPIGEEVAILLFLATRELLFNVVKHAQVKVASVEVSSRATELRVLVADEGSGFDPKQLQVAGGTAAGFGLLSLRERLDLMGGHMEVDSAPGRGSRFTLVAPLPRVQAKLESLHAGPAQAAQAPAPARKNDTPPSRDGKNKIRVMLVDDHVIMRQGLAELLRGEPDLEVVGEAADGLAAVERACDCRPHVVLMDINMPGMNGIDATQILHSELPEVRVIGLSMFEDEEQAAAMREAGAVAYCSKGTAPASLIATIRDSARPIKSPARRKTSKRK